MASTACPEDDPLLISDLLEWAARLVGELEAEKTNYYPSTIIRLWKHFIGQGKFWGIADMFFFFK